MSLRQITNLIQYIEKHTDLDKAKKITEPLRGIKKSTKPEKRALLVKQAIEDMNTHLTPEIVTKIMSSCGKDCATHNRRAIDAALKRRRKHPTLQAYLEAEENNPQKGTRLKLEGNTITLWYTQNTYTRPMRCYCGLQRSLPVDVTTHINYCKCSEAFVKTQWEQILGQPVEVKVIKSAISGSDECQFQIQPI